MQKITLKFIAIGALAGVLMSGFFAFYAKATVNFSQKINYQGKLENSSGIGVTDGSYCLKFRLMDSLASGSEIWSEVWDNSNKVATTNGLFSIMLGSVTSLASVNFNQSMWLEVRFDPTCTGGNYSDASPEIFAPRKPLGAVPAMAERASR